MSRKMNIVCIVLYFVVGGLNLYNGLKIEPRNALSILSGALFLLAGSMRLYSTFGRKK